MTGDQAAPHARSNGAVAAPARRRGRDSGLVMLCDVDLESFDATRTHTLEVAGCFAAEGFDVDLVARGSDPDVPGVRFHPGQGLENQKRALRVLSTSLVTIGLLWSRRRTAQRLYVRHRWSTVPVMVAGRLLSYRVVTQVDDVPYGRGYELEQPWAVDHLKRITAILMGRLAHGVVAVTPEIKGLLVDQFHTPADRVAALRNGVDVDFFHPVPRAEAIARAGPDPELRYLAFSGRFQPWVDFDLMLEAFAIVHAGEPDTRLILIGDGGERDRIEASMQRLGISDSVSVTGMIRDRAKVRDLMCSATVALAAHQREHVGHIGVSPTKVAEYFAVGRAVVAKDVPGIREAVQETGAGIVVAGDPRAMADAIISLLEPGRADELGARGRQAAEALYTWRSVVRRTLPLFGLDGDGA